MTIKATHTAHKVGDIMSKEVVYADCADSVHDVINLLVENRVSALPVVNGKAQCVGMISTSDFLDLTQDVNEDILQLDETFSLGGSWLTDKLRQEFGDVTIKEIMSVDVQTVGPDTTAREAAAEMLKFHVHRLPVVDEGGRLLGIVSTMDIMAVLAEKI